MGDTPPAGFPPLTDDAGRGADPLADRPEAAALRARIRDLLAEHAPPEHVTSLDEAETFDDDLAVRLGEAGVFALGAPGEVGGSGDIRDQAVAIEELASGPTSMAVYTIVHYMVVHLVARYGSAAQRQRWSEPLARGTCRVSFALSEPAGGTDVLRAMGTIVRHTDDGWQLDGTKRWIGGVQHADLVVVLAREHGEPGDAEGVTMLCVPGGTAGLSARVIDTVGIRGLDTNEVTFDQVRLPADAVLGTSGNGFRQVLGTLNRERVTCAASALGIARGALGVSLQYARDRHAFGRPLGAFQTLQHRLVDDAVAVESAASLLSRAAAVEAAGGRADLLASMAKIAASDAAARTTDDGMRLFAGNGFDRANPIQRYFRDARLYTFAPLTNEMMRNYLGERMLGLPRSF